jgi:hypothetical protein
MAGAHCRCLQWLKSLREHSPEAVLKTEEQYYHNNLNVNTCSCFFNAPDYKNYCDYSVASKQLALGDSKIHNEKTGLETRN